MTADTRRVGTFTAGIALVVVGLAAGAETLFPGLGIARVVSNFWPVVPILLGTELLVSAKKGGALRVDFPSLLIMFITVCASSALVLSQMYTAGR